jgi:hypothetical protein
VRSSYANPIRISVLGTIILPLQLTLGPDSTDKRGGIEHIPQKVAPLHSIEDFFKAREKIKLDDYSICPFLLSIYGKKDGLNI